MLGLCCCRGSSLVAMMGATPCLQCMGFSVRWLLLLQSTGSVVCGLGSCGSQASEFVVPGLWSTRLRVVAHGLSCFSERGIFLDQGSNPGLLHCRQTLYHFPHSSDGKESACNAEDLGSIAGSGRFPGMATHSSILAWRISMDRGAWLATVHGVSKSRTH